MSSRVLAIGDIHGCADALDLLLQRAEVGPQDTVVLLGDLIDQGPDTKGAIDRLIDLRKEANVILIMGNHEEMMRNALSSHGLMNTWLENGGQETVDSYGGDVIDIPPDHLRFLLSCQPYWENDNDMFIHASLEFGVGLANQTSEFLRWKHLGGMERPHVSGKRVICGHTPQTDGVPLVLDGWVCLDTYAFGGQFLSCLDTTADHVYQASNDGETREFPLSKYATG